MAFENRVRGKGWKPDPPSLNDWPFRLSSSGHAPGGAVGAYRPESPDRRADNPPVRDQGNLGSCVGFSLTYAVGWLRRNDKDSLSTNYSPLQAYYDARIRDGQQWKDVDAGAYIRDGIDALRHIGVAPESRWPYNQRRFAVTPNKTTYKEAARWKLGAAWRCANLDEILLAIDKGYAVVGGISCFSSMFTSEVDSTGRIPLPTPGDRFEGGHALYFDRYTSADRLVRVQNSWGAEWGDGGYGYLPFEYVARRDLSDDYWALQAESPETTPWKD